MVNVLELIDKRGRQIYLTQERWSHIQQDHGEVSLEDIEHTLKKDDPMSYSFHSRKRAA